MKLSSTLVTAALVAVSVVYAAPLQRRAGVGNKKKMAETTSFDSSGAVYCERYFSSDETYLTTCF